MRLPGNSPTKRFLIVLVAALLGWQALTAVADVLNGSPTPTPTEQPQAPAPTPEVDTSSITAGDTPSPTPSPSSTATITYIPIPTNSPAAAPTFADNQSVQLKAPATIPVDPRATQATLPAIYLHGSDYVLACVATQGARAIINGGNNSDTTTGTTLITGNNSTRLYLSGTSAQVTQSINSGTGLKLIGTSASSRVTGAFVTIKIAALTAPSLDSTFCGQAAAAHTTTVTTLGLDLNLQKNTIGLKGK